jgi:hypothetical protein
VPFPDHAGVQEEAVVSEETEAETKEETDGESIIRMKEKIWRTGNG